MNADVTEQPATGLRAMPRGVWALGCVSLFMDISSEMIHGLLPVFLTSVLGASAEMVGLIEGVGEATASISKLFSGSTDILHRPLYRFDCEAIVRPPSKIVTAIVSAWIGIHVNPAAAQSFQERWSIIPKAHAEQPPATSLEIGSDPQAKSRVGTKPARGLEDRIGIRFSKRSFSGKASFYSYRTGKTARGSAFNRNLPTAAHRSLPFGHESSCD